jgi:sugar phosphate isomerase/epimerase
MRLLIFRSLWTNGFDLDGALHDCRSGVFDGVEGPVPTGAADRRAFLAKLADAGVAFIAEIATGGGYVPTERSVEAHLDDFKRRAEAARAGSPMLLTVLGGCDHWPLAQSVRFFGQALEFAAGLGLPAAFETHRSRPTFNPWATRDLLEALPDLRLTCDFSHWCCVAERLVLDEEPLLLRQLAACARHVHARVGYEQGPQVPHPSAPEYQGAVAAHERWWDEIWAAQAGREFTTLTPEFGPDGYLHTEPFTGAPVADLDAINREMAVRQRARFAASNRPRSIAAPAGVRPARTE